MVRNELVRDEFCCQYTRDSQDLVPRHAYTSIQLSILAVKVRESNPGRRSRDDSFCARDVHSFEEEPALEKASASERNKGTTWYQQLLD
jgi:hypothetical protein